MALDVTVLSPEHVGRYMRTRDGARIGPVEYDANAFGLPGDKQWRAPLDWARAYYWGNGRISLDEQSPNDIVGEWQVMNLAE